MLGLFIFYLPNIDRIDLRAAKLDVINNVSQLQPVSSDGWLAFDNNTSYGKAVHTSELNLQSEINGSFTLEAFFQMATSAGTRHPWVSSIVRTRAGYGVGIVNTCSGNSPWGCTQQLHFYKGLYNSYPVPVNHGEVSPGPWYHIALVNDGSSGEVRLYFNGGLIYSSYSPYSAGEVGDLWVRLHDENLRHGCKCNVGHR